MKDVFKANGLPIVEYLWFYRSSWKNNREQVIKEIEGS